MVSFVSAVKSVSVNGRRRKLTGRPKEEVIRRALMRNVIKPPLTQVNKMKTDVQVADAAPNANFKEMIAYMKGALDSCGDWAPWSRVK